MSKEAYFEMCEALKTEPNEDEIPLDLQDFPELVQNIIIIYSKLTDTWDTMGGKYMGKDYGLVFELFKLYDVSSRDEKLLAMELLAIMDNARIKIISDKVSAETSRSKKPR